MADAEPHVRPRAARGEGDHLRDELMDAAETLLIREGSMDAVAVRAIAAEVGVTPPSLYLHFADKDELFFEVCQRRFADFEATMRQALVEADGDDPITRLRTLGRSYVRYGIERSEHYQIIFGLRIADVVGDRDVTDAPGMRAFGMLVELIDEGVADGSFRDQDTWLAALSTWSAVHGAVMVLLSHQSIADQFPLPTPEQLADHVCETIILGLASRD